MSIGIFLADDHRLMVEGFKSTLQSDEINVVDVVYDLDGLPEKFLTSSADVLVIDVRFRGNSNKTGLDACEKILTSNPDKKIVVFSQFDDQWIVERTYQLGVLAFVRKDEDPKVLVQAIQSAVNGKDFFSPVVAQLLAWSSVKSPSPSRLLDEKELKVFMFTADGVSATEIAQKMELSYKTILLMIKSAKKKLNIDSVADFTKLAIKYGLSDLDIEK